MKNLILLTTLFIGLNTFAANGNPVINAKVLKTFNHVFKDAKNVYWYKHTNYLQASFTDGDIKTKAYIDSNGQLLQTIRYYKENNLPANVLYKLNKKYSQQTIWGVVEVSDNRSTNYHITLKDRNNWYKIQVTNEGNIVLKKKFKRGDI
ncbi:MAG: hypothetical protein ACK5NK_14815 [Niabella sp.]